MSSMKIQIIVSCINLLCEIRSLHECVRGRGGRGYTEMCRRIFTEVLIAILSQL